MSKISIGILGAGSIVEQRHLPGLAEDPDARVLAVCNRTRATAEAVAEKWGVPRVTTDWREIIAMDDVDAVIIGAWPYTHAEMSIAALDAGKHVFCQARMARNAAEARAMVQAATAHPELTTMLCPPPAGMLGDRFVRQLIADDFLGDLRAVHATGFSAGNLDAEAPLHWRQDFEVQGYNTLTLGMWLEVIHRWVGPHRSVSAQLQVHTPQRRDPKSGEMVNVRIAESVAIAAELECGAIGCYHFSGVCPHAPPDVIQLHGTRGSLVYDLSTDEIQGAQLGDKGLHPLPIPDDLRREWTVEADFLHAIRTDGPTEPSFADGLLYMEFTEAVYRSAQGGVAVALPLG